MKVEHDDSPDGVTVAQWKTKFKSVPSLVTDVSGMSNYRGVQLEETISTVVEMHRLKSLTPDMRIVYGTRILEIKAVKLWRNGTAREKHLVMCTEVVV